MADPQEPTETKGEIGTPTVVVSHLDVKFTVFGGGRRGVPSGQEGSPSLKDRLKQRPPPKVREIHAVKDVSFVARHGESIGIIGRNGSGKSTLLRAVGGLIPPSSGRLWVSGEPSLLGVNAVLMNKLSGERNIYIGAQALGLSKSQIAQRFDDIVEFSGIGDAVYLPMSTYSSGMGARLRFAISTAAAPDVLMIDEALATGDADFRAKSAARIAEIRDQAGTVFLVSHSNSSIRQICDRVLWMDQGRLVMDGPTEEVLPAYEATLPKKVDRKKASRPSEPDVPGTTRWSGDNRFQVATQITSHTWEPGVAGCFVVSIHRLAAARVVTPIAARLGWPLLWVRPGAVPAITQKELARLQPERVVVVGGDELITPETYARIDELTTGSIERMGDDDGTLTSVEMLRAYPPTDPSTVHVTQQHSSGRTPAISLAAAVAGQAVVACDPTAASADLLTALAETGPQHLLFNGNEEDWSMDTVEALRTATGATTEFSPTGGPMALAAGLWGDVEPGSEVLVTGRAAVDVLTAAVAAVHTRRPLLLFAGDRVPTLVSEVLTQLQPRHIVLAGTMESLPPAIRTALGDLVTPGDSAPR
ncbi:ATP-binding cassette domain-containing protein [Janibacter sp. GS2]|uniref:ATP-binding cassette domain-containing protein n=1 Tax=Janibacter sp. GS2 TaxID=3442646 RepID=UPI003EBCAB70